MFEELKKISTAAFRGRSIPVAMLLILVALLSAGSGLHAGASFFAQQAPNVTTTTTIYTTTTSWTTSTIWSTVTEVVEGVMTTIEYTTSTSTVTISTTTPTGSARTYGDTVREAARNFGANYIYTNSFTTSIPMTVIAISYYSGIRQNVRVGIYSGSSGSPRGKLAETSLDSCDAGAWHSFTISYSLPVGTYWLAFTFSGSGSGNVYAKAGGTDKYMAHTYDGTLPATYIVTGTQAYTYSVYATGVG